MEYIKTFESFLNESQFKKGDILVHDKSGEEVEFQSHISPIKMSVKNNKGTDLIVSPMYYTLKLK